MVDIWDLGRYVEGHPDEYEQRWRLAKKLYLACEYRLALEHLQVLKNEWTRKLNVVRYLAATYYRLGRYEEAVQELEEAIEVWPGEIGLREQLARVLEVAGRSTDASRVWEQVAAMDPEHPIARRAAQRLVAPQENSPEEDLRIVESDSGIDLAPRRICPQCGAQNSAEFDRCWQCHGALTASTASGPLPRVPARPAELRLAVNIMAALLCLAILAYAVAVGLTSLPRHEPIPGVEVPPTVHAGLFNKLMHVRLVFGLVLLVVWPIGLFIPLRRVPSDQPNPLIVAGTGVLLAAAAFGASWAPLQLAGQMAVLLALVSFLIILATFGLSFRDTVIVWVFQGVFAALAGAVAVIAVEGPQPILEAPAVIRYAAAHDGAADPPYRFEAPPAVMPARYTIQTRSSGSKWLDQKLSLAQFEIRHSASGPDISLDLVHDGVAVVFQQFSQSPYRVSYPLEADHPYELNVRGSVEQKGSDVKLVVYSLLEPRFATQ